MTSFKPEDLANLLIGETHANRSDFDDIQADVQKWADETIGAFDTFGAFDAEGVLKHLQEEVNELSASLRLNDKSHVILEECADVVLLIMQIASSRRGSLERAVNLKHQVNQTDEWEYRPELGYSKRVKR